ncbi:uncharacterized protein LOC144363027 [Saccoglossus kowalevskii]
MTTSHNRGGLRHHSYPANQMDNTNHRENESPVAKPLRRASQPPTNREAAARLDPRVRKESILSTLNAMNRMSPADDKNKLSAVPDHDEVTMATLRERFRKSVSVAPDLASLDVNPNSNQRRKSSHTMTSGTLFAVMHARKHFRYKNREIRKSQKKLCILFRAIARVAILLNRICAWHYQRIKEVGNKNLTFSELHEDPQVELMFDVTKYKANKELRISKEAKHILMKTPSERTEHELYLVTIALRNVKSIAEYPVRMQRSVAEVGWYEAYDAKRVIVREGQPPISFYFLLSGSAVVTIMDREKELATTVAIIKRGDSFGELAILNGSTRTSSVTARENVEMICISAQDFTRIFMSGGAKNLVDPDRNSFIKSIEFLKGWPLHLLAERPNMCIFNYFTSCTVLVRDSRQSNWIYIVKSGSCSVLKRLHQVKPRRKTGKRKRSFQEDTDTDDNHRDRLDQRVTTLLSKKKIDLKRNTVAKYDMPLVSTNVDFESVPPTRLASAASVTSTHRLPTANHQRNQPMESLRKKSKDEHSFSGAYRTDDPITDDRHSNWSFAKGPFLTRSKYDTSAKSTADYRAAELVSLSADGDCLVGNTRTLPDDLNIGYKADDTFAGKKPIFVRVQTLVKGAVFGLADVLFDDQPSLSLVSNGAECIVISKRLFMDHASDDLITKLRLEERPYITDEEMQHNLERQLHWNGFRKTTLQKAALVVKQRRRERRNRRHTLGVLT